MKSVSQNCVCKVTGIVFHCDQDKDKLEVIFTDKAPFDQEVFKMDGCWVVWISPAIV